MAETVVVEAASWGSVYRSFNGDGTATFWANSFLPLWGRVCAIAAYLRDDETIPVAGATLQGFDTGDGASLIGMPATAMGGWAGGTLFAFLDGLGDSLLAFIDTVALKGGSTITGPFIFSGSTARVVYREPVTLSGSTSTLTLDFDFGIVPDAASPRIYTIPAATSKGQWFVARRNVVGGGANVNFARVDTTNLCTLPNSAIGWVMFVAQDNGAGGIEWSAWAWGGAATVHGS